MLAAGAWLQADTSRGAVLPTGVETATRSWFEHRPATGPLIPGRVDTMLAAARRMRPLSSLLVWHRGDVVVEEYFRGARADRAVNLKSVSKTLLSPLVDVAIRDSLIPGADVPLRELLPELYDRLDGSDAYDPRKDDITLQHLLDMSSGLQSTSFGNYGSWVASGNWAWDQLRRPMECRPGRCYHYSTGSTHLLGIALARAAGRDLRSFANEALYAQLGIRLSPWDRDPQGNFLGGNNMSLRPRELLSLGVLYASGGVHDGEQLVSPDWIEESWRPKFRSPWNGQGYGNLWWTARWAGETAHSAWGYGGQFLVVVPRLDLVIVATSSLNRTERGHTRRMRAFFDRYAIPAFQPF